MAEKSTFFNSVSGDRKYKAEDMAAHFAKVLTNGVMPSGTQLQATEDSGMNVIVSAGSAWINGYAYHNDSDFTLTFDAADGVLNRIDRIVVRWGRLARSINLAIIKGTPASSPSAPAVVRNADYYDLGIATVAIDAGITAITQAMITDTRLDSSVCGFVSSLIQPDTSGWFDQFNSAFTSAIAESQSAWDVWFETLEDILDENVAGNLLNLINDLAGPGRTNETVKGVSDALASHTADYEYQTPTIVGTQIRLEKQSNTNILKFKLAANLSGGDLTISLDAGATSKPLLDLDGAAVSSLDKGFVEVISDAANFTIRPKGGAKINALLADYIVESGQTISAGDLVSFINNKVTLPRHAIGTSDFAIYENGNVGQLNAAILDSTHVLVAYTNNNVYGTAIVLTISGNTITAGIPVVFESAVISYIQVNILDSTHAVVVYRDQGNSNYGTAIVLTITGTTITAGTPFVFESADTQYISSCTLSSTKVFVSYADFGNSQYGTAIILTVSGTTITAGIPFVFASVYYRGGSACKIDSTKVLLPYDVSNNNGCVVILTITGTTITAGTSYAYTTQRSDYVSAGLLDSTHALVVYQNIDSAYYGTAVVLTINGTAITKGTAIIFISDRIYGPKLCILDSTKAIVIYRKATDGFFTAHMLSVSGSDIVVGEALFTMMAISSLAICKIDTTKTLAVTNMTLKGVAQILTAMKAAQGVAVKGGASGETIKCYDWR